MTKVEWRGNELFIHWYGIESKEADAYWLPRINRLLFQGSGEDFNRKLSDKPSAEEALRLISNWQHS